MKRIDIQEKIFNKGLDIMYLTSERISEFDKCNSEEFYRKMFQGPGWYDSSGKKYNKKQIINLIEV